MSDNKIELSGVFSEGYGTIPKKLMRMKINKNLKLILAYMLSFTGGGDTCFPGIRTIAEDLDLSTTTVTKYLKEAVDMGLITKSKLNDNPMNHAHKYKLVFLTHDVSPTDTPDVSAGETTMCQQVKQNNNTINNNNDNNKENLSVPDYSFKNDTLCKNIEDSFVLIEPFTDFAIERKAIKRIAGYIYKDAEIHSREPCEYAHQFMESFYSIHNDQRHFLHTTPFKPSAVSYNIYQRIIEATKEKTQELTPDQEQALAWLMRKKKK